MADYGYLPDDDAQTDAQLEADLRRYLGQEAPQNYLDRPQPPTYPAVGPQPPTYPAAGPQAPPRPPTNYLDQAGQSVHQALGPHASQAAQNFLELTPMAGLRDYGREGSKVVRDMLGGDWSKALYGAPVAAMALMGAAPGGKAGSILRSKIRPSKENMRTVLDSNFTSGRVMGDETAKVRDITGGPSVSDTAKVDALAKQMKSPEGYFERIIVDADGTVVEGAHRLAAARKLGLEDIPITRVGEATAGLPAAAMTNAVRGIGGLHKEQVDQVVAHASDAIKEAGSVDAAIAGYDMPGGFDKHFKAALNAAKGSAAMKAWRKPAVGGPYPRVYTGTPHEYPPVNVVRDPETGRELGVFKEGEAIPEKWANYPVEHHPLGRKDWSKIGTGEGAQAYGHGHYAAEARGVAESYQQALARPDVKFKGEAANDVLSKLPQNVMQLAKQRGINIEDAARIWDAEKIGVTRSALENLQTFGAVPVAKRQSSEAVARRIDELVKSGEVELPRGHLYESALKAKPEEMLDWDAPLAKQHEGARKTLHENWLAHPEDHAHQTGEQIWYAMVREHGDPETAAMALRESGIKAIRYKDAMSRERRVAYKGKDVNQFEASEKWTDAQGLLAGKIERGDSPEVALRELRKSTKGLLEQAERSASGEVWAAGAKARGISDTDTLRVESLRRMMSDLKEMKAEDWQVKPPTYNYVALDDDTIEILAKYGIAGLIGGGAAMEMDNFLGGSVDETPTGA